MEPTKREQKYVSQRAAVYRLWDADGNLLYVGSAYDPDHRCKAHQDKPWWADVARRTEEWHATRGKAYVAEMDAIAIEEPKHNRMGTPGYTTPDTEAIRKRKQLASQRQQLVREADAIGAEVARAARREGSRPEVAERAGKLATIEFMERTGLFEGAVKWRRRLLASDEQRRREEVRDDPSADART